MIIVTFIPYLTVNGQHVIISYSLDVAHAIGTKERDIPALVKCKQRTN